MSPRLVAEAHKNLHRTFGRSASFAAVAERDGFHVEPSTAVFSAAPEGAVLVIANAWRAEKDEDAAFSLAEVERLRS